MEVTQVNPDFLLWFPRAAWEPRLPRRGEFMPQRGQALHSHTAHRNLQATRDEL